MKSITWYTVKDGKIHRIQTVREGEKPLPEGLDWHMSPNNNLHPETPIDRYDENMRYLDDSEWLKKRGKPDLRGDWYDKETREKKTITSINAIVDEKKLTREIPIENELYQKWDEKKKQWVVDAEKKEEAEKQKEEAEKQNEISAKQAEIEAAEKAILRSVIAKLSDTATKEDEEFFQQYAKKIVTLREEKRELLSA